MTGNPPNVWDRPILRALGGTILGALCWGLLGQVLIGTDGTFRQLTSRGALVGLIAGAILPSAALFVFWLITSLWSA